MDPAHLEIKSLDGRQHDARLQGGTVCSEQPVESARQLVVVDLALGDETRIEQCGPFPNRIERVAVDEDVLHQPEESIGVAGIPHC